MCHQKSRFFGDGMVIPPLNRNPYNGYINPYYWVDFSHPLLYGNNGSLDSSNARRSDPHCENAPDAGGGVKSPIKQVSYAYDLKPNKHIKSITHLMVYLKPIKQVSPSKHINHLKPNKIVKNSSFNFFSTS